ncbi:agmatinase [Hydrogenibacillus sp. N12]|uniref:agmatinase n=1 Tax=Hydrogenibacillus sp. N12 TaxID=2866627 RepID=UPI001C7D50EE|nr:agmatinase [Hydrogenibacillus sp. N12]QZA32981.1 agmatinase [Hydrogenibacillus sp. N12]
MIVPEAESGRRFLGSKGEAEAAVVLFGAPMDWTVSFRPGARFGPEAIRRASVVLETYSPALDGDLADVLYADAGDVALPFGNTALALERLEAVAAGLVAAGKVPFALGGEHLVSLPLVRAVRRRYPDLAVVHIDAHADYREAYEGEVLSHATVIRRIAEAVGGGRVFSFAVRSGTAEEFRAARSELRFFPFALAEPLEAVLPELAGRPVYLTVDIDALDPAYAPGTGTPEPDGISPAELFSALRRLAAAGVRLVGADLVEVAPAYDPTERTAVLAAKIVRELLIGFWSRRRSVL